MNKKINYIFIGKIENLCNDIAEEIESREIEEIEKGFEENLFCDSYGICQGINCPNYYKCKI